MSEETINDKLELIDLSHRAEILAKNLKSLSGDCGHDKASVDISHAADELSLLSTVLSDLVQAVNAAKDQYTQTFNQDLGEICHQLESIFEDVEDCCREMHKTAVGWLRKRKYVEKLHKHMEASIRTLIVMRTVLLHGKSYGLHTSGGRLAESAPHVLQEDHVILETVFATRNAITNLRTSPTKSHWHTSSNSSSAASTEIPTFVPGAHGRNLSSATGVDTPVFEDVLPSSNRSGGKQRSNYDHLAERFAKRGGRLAVHSSFLDNNAHDIPNALKERWVHNARARCSMEQIDSGGPSNAPLGTIPEYNSSSSPEEVAGAEIDRPEQKMPAASSSEESTHANLSKAKKMGRTLMAMPMGRSMDKVIRGLRSTKLNQSENKEKDKAVELEPDEGPDKSSDKIGWTYRFTKRFERPELTTPDYNKDSENMVLR
ncbi:hypothetical protein LTR10_019316 [Elasticomyces elasticus]|uniref:Fungal N-terminal domain-containing protein n=1 Tax=Exophiala sideris TaxID=1016849 RepID=A0ABR0J1C9_9EURO|nr:hypothetical protein LTR10_019316 [Elasticomyces elasticus]KAK5024317.1 hypothetical protein LTS07_008608 [Exophiala sideris]KAK5031001.1 hypothetical protein LTR13_008014 [Exophiala sideris]KAK5054050.1 hypothetical protein LTR69_009012 [Exophiala sideris]KAK5179594.1 hypothetical protein LTR44_008110 [Eurotiomycetes sp. CCFEE 6388]